MLNADLLESISETRYLTADNYMVYRTILRIFYVPFQDKCCRGNRRINMQNIQE